MRRRSWVFAGLLSLLLSDGLSAQQQGDLKTGLTGVDPGKVTFSKVDIPKMPTPSPLNTPSAFTRFFRHLNPFSSSTRKGPRMNSQPSFGNAFKLVEPKTMTVEQK